MSSYPVVLNVYDMVSTTYFIGEAISDLGFRQIFIALYVRDKRRGSFNDLLILVIFVFCCIV